MTRLSPTKRVSPGVCLFEEALKNPNGAEDETTRAASASR